MPTALPWASHAQTLTALYGLPAWSFRDFTFWGMPGETTVYMAIAGSSHPNPTSIGNSKTRIQNPKSTPPTHPNSRRAEN